MEEKNTATRRPTRNVPFQSEESESRRQRGTGPQRREGTVMERSDLNQCVSYLALKKNDRERNKGKQNPSAAR